MKNADNSFSRRNFIKGAAVNAAALSVMPIDVFSNDLVFKGQSIVSNAPRLPLRIMMKSGLSDPYLEKLMKISPQIQLERDDKAIGEVDVWFGGINSKQFVSAAKLKWFQTNSAGVEEYLFPEILKSNVIMTSAKGCFAPAIAEHTFGLLFGLTRNILGQIRNMSQGKWQGVPMGNMFEMKGKTLGIVGLGGIGSQVARRARAMDMRVIAVDIVPKYKEQIGDICEEFRHVQGEGLTWLLKSSDVVLIAAPHTKVSEGMIGAEQFGMMKKSAYFINVSRGKLVKTPALLNALKSGQIAGAGLDVVDPEPLPADHELWTLPNVIITSHISARSQFNLPRLYEVFVENVYRYVNEFPLLNTVDKEMGF
jgi:phosphoglycerate dehydrogenase-like enzyme